MDKTQQFNPGQIASSILTALSYEQLAYLQEELKMPNNYFSYSVNQKMRELQTTQTKNCASCGSIFGEAHNPYTLVFGNNGLKKRASFCGLDCLHEFTQQYGTQLTPGVKKT